MLKTKEALIPYLLLVAALAGGLLWHQSESVPQLGRTIGSGAAVVGGDYALTDQTGRPRSSTDFRGKYQLVYFGYSFCPDVCPTTLAVMADALARLGADEARIVPVFITIDPERDTPAILKPYMAAFGPRFVGLTGSPAQIGAVEKSFRVYARKQPLEPGQGNKDNTRGYGMDHSSVLYLMGPDGKLVSFYSELISAEALARELRSKL